jgi:formamidopyrimidine-DNA glycosylase
MPELPEVETVRTGLRTLVLNRRITGLRVGVFEGVVGDLGVDATRARLLDRTIVDVARRAKYLFLVLDDETFLSVHLRMTGVLQVVPRDAAPLRFEHLAIELDDGNDLRYSDQRKFGRVLHIESSGYDEHDRFLGPEPLEPSFTPAVLAERLRGRTAPIKASLLDQRRVAGLGNIYVDEALFRAGIHPLRPAGSMTAPEAERLHAAIQAVLSEAIARQGTTFSSFSNPYGESGNNQPNLRVYGRGRKGEPCLICGSALELLTVGGRSTHFCAVCQPLDIPANTG